MKGATIAGLLVGMLSTACTQQSGREAKVEAMGGGCGKAMFGETTTDMGTLKSGEVAGKKYKLRNIGDGPLTIVSVEAGCKCTTVKYPTRPIAVNECVDVEVIFDSSGMHGYQYKTVEVMTNGCQTEITKLAFTANIEY